MRLFTAEIGDHLGRVSSAFAATSGEEATAFGGDMDGNFVEGEFGVD